jgi:septal ring factor EnvC (AmiA/AmiB activator)
MRRASRANVAYYGYIQRARRRDHRELRQAGRFAPALQQEAIAPPKELAQNERRSPPNGAAEKERAERAKVVARHLGRHREGRKEIGRLKRDEERLAKLVDRIAKALAAPPAPAKGMRSRGSPTRASRRSPFERLKGRLQLPVRGELTNQYGRRAKRGDLEGTVHPLGFR